MTFEPQSKKWPGKRAVLLVHGVGNARPGDYRKLVARIEELLGEDASEFAIYQLFYDAINDWFAEKTGLADKLKQMTGFVQESLVGNALTDVFAEFAADVVWPVLSQSARTAIREAYLAQVKQMVLDGIQAGVRPKRQKLNIICHSLGCFHTYEAVHAAARFPSHGLQPATHGVQFENVVYMASPVQFIRSVSTKISGLIPSRWMATADPNGLFLPSEESYGSQVPSVKNWVSITGELDPVGGYFNRKLHAWAYMTLQGQDSQVDPQEHLGIKDESELERTLRASMRKGAPPEIHDKNPHSWVGYAARYSDKLHEWMTS